MQFFEENQIAQWYADHGLPLERGTRDPTVMRSFFGQAASTTGQEEEISTAALEALGTWDQCLLWIQLWSIWPSSEDWPKYYAERAAQHERRSLEVAPGHLFESTERGLLLRFLQLVLENAWEAEAYPVMAGTPTGRRLFVSHDEFVEISTFPLSLPAV